MKFAKDWELKMVNILHIGPTRDAHVAEMIKQIKEKTNFNNVILSPSKQHYWSENDYYSTIKTHVCEGFTTNMKEVVDKVLNEEKPDLIIGHSLSEVATIMSYILSVYNKPSLVTIWGSHDCIKSLRNNITRARFTNNSDLVKKVNFILATNKVLIQECIRTYKIENSDFVEALYPINLNQYTAHVPNTARPKLLIGKSRGEEFLLPGLPKIFKLFPKLEVHALELPKSVEYAKKLGIYNRIMYHKYPLSQEDFSNMIKSCNIVYTLTGDPGTGATSLQVSYAGCVNLMRRCTTSRGILEDLKNVIMCNTNITDVMNRLSYSIRNLDMLCKRFKQNNAHLIKYDKEKTWNVLYSGMLACLEGKKERIGESK